MKIEALILAAALVAATTATPARADDAPLTLPVLACSILVNGQERDECSTVSVSRAAFCLDANWPAGRGVICFTIRLSRIAGEWPVSGVAVRAPHGRDTMKAVGKCTITRDDEHVWAACSAWTQGGTSLAFAAAFSGD